MSEHEFLLLYYLRLRRKNVFTRAKTYIHNIDATVDLVKRGTFALTFLLPAMVKADIMKKIAGVLKLFRVQQLTDMPSVMWNRSKIYWITFLVTNTSKKTPHRLGDQNRRIYSLYRIPHKISVSFSSFVISIEVFSAEESVSTQW